MRLNNFGWFMNGCYAMSILTLVVFDINFEVPIWVYIMMVAGVCINILSQQKKEVKNGLATNNKSTR